MTGLVMILGAVMGTTVQEVPERTLEAEPALSETLSRVRGVRELSDGRVLFADQFEKALYRIDFESGSRIRIGREGEGPQEFMTPIGLVPFRGDSTILRDLENRRFAVVDPDGNVGRTFPLLRFDYFIGALAATDEGVIYFSSSISMAGSRSRHVLRWDPSENTLDTLAELASAERFVDKGREWPVPWSTSETWALGPDGRVFLVRKNPYRIEVLHRDGRLVSREVDYDPVPVRRADRTDWNERPRVNVASTSGQQIVLPDNWAFPDHFDPFLYNAASVTPDGMLWVERQQGVEEDRALFDVFDLDGNLVERVRLPAGVHPVGFGNGVVYGTVQDELELLYPVRLR